MRSAEIGSKKAVPRLTEMLQSGNAKAIPIVVRALGKLGDAKLIDPLLPFASRPEREVRIEAIQSAFEDRRRASRGSAAKPSCKTHLSLAGPDDCAHCACRMSELENRLSGGLAPAPVGHHRPTAAISPTSLRPPQPTAPPAEARENTADVRSCRRTGGEAR